MTSATRTSSSTCPACRRRLPKPRGRTMVCPHCQYSRRRDLVAAAIIATRTPGRRTHHPHSRRAAAGGHAPYTYPVPALGLPGGLG
ncbi:zinc ribbon domain-containing protein [Micromonospora sp. SL4-19]|uniref:zinc ribbon domain-containing protein n=1 Tax=Micromonospora sp. SL4-19 TaxID=3399129 RepID=UPI003A4E2C84